MSRLQTRLILSFLLIVLIPTAIITTFAWSSTSNQLIEVQRTNALENSRRISISITNFLDRLKSDVLFLSRGGGAANYLDLLTVGDSTAIQNRVSTMQTFFLDYARNTGFYDQIMFINKDGQEIVHLSSSNGQPLIVPRRRLENRAGEVFFQQAQKLPAGSVYLSSMTLETTDGKPVQPYQPLVTVATPVVDSLGGLGGVLALVVKADPFTTIIKSSAGSQSIYMLDVDGTYLIGANESKLFGRDLGTGASFSKDYPEDATQVLAQPEGSLFGTRNQPDLLQVFERVPGTPWIVYYTQSNAAIYGNINNALLVLIGLALLAVIGSIAVAVVLTRSIVLPVVALTNSARAIAEGDLAQTVPPQIQAVKNEIGTLAQAFNTMVQRLAVAYGTLEKRVEERTEQLSEAQQRAERASRAKSVFLSNMSHELRTPLNVIIGYSSSILFRPQMYNNVDLPSVYRPDIQLIEDSGQYLLGLINDILDLSRIEEGRLQLNMTTVELPSMLQGVVATALGLVKNKPVKVSARYPDHLPLVQADPVRARQIILNLLSNAAKFTESGSITVSADVVDQFVKISVTDTGIGIPENALSYIFDRYRQAEQDTDKRYGGTGLGLDISKQLARMHGDDLMVHSTIGQGSTFSFKLRVAEPVAAAPVISAPSDQYLAAIFEPEVALSPESLTIVLVADDLILRQSVHNTLENAGHMVVDADSAQTLTVVSGLAPDLIVVDGAVSGIGRHELLDQLHNNLDSASIPVLLLADEMDTSIPAVMTVLKPITPDMLLQTVRNFLTEKDKSK